MSGQKWINLEDYGWLKEAVKYWNEDKLYFDGYNYRIVRPESRKGKGPIYLWNKELKRLFSKPRLLHYYAGYRDEFLKNYPNYFIHRVE
jgi:hypothetical protein